jgi:hypothetical protein
MLSSRVTGIVLLVGVALSAGVLRASAAPILSIAPSSQAVQLGQQFSFTVDITSGPTILQLFIQ